jgi:hypothetical protein
MSRPIVFSRWFKKRVRRGHFYSDRSPVDPEILYLIFRSVDMVLFARSIAVSNEILRLRVQEEVDR